MPSVIWICFLGFWLINMYVVWRGVESIRFLQSFSAPFLLVNLNTTANANIRVQYDARDIEAGADNAIQKLALHYRVGNTGLWTNVPAAYIADATDGPQLATKVTHVDVTLPAACANQPLLQIRVMTTNAVGNDEWVGIDNISVTGNATTAVSPTTWGAMKRWFH